MGDHNLRDPRTLEERRDAAKMCESAMEYGIRTYVDKMDDPVMKAYAAWPERLYLVGKDGRVAFAGGIGPFDFHPHELKAAIAELLAKKGRG